MQIKRVLRKLLGLELPVWSHGLTCEICNTSFVDAESHFKYAAVNGRLYKHQGKIPILEKEVKICQ